MMENRAAYIVEVHPLSPRELQVLSGLAADHSIKEMAGDLGIAVSTIRGYLGRAKRKLGVRSSEAAIMEAMRRGYPVVDLPT
jgi:DNA-binding CsgD family transcriptional regulator